MFFYFKSQGTSINDFCFIVKGPFTWYPKSFSEMDNLVYEHPTEKRHCSYWSLEHLLSGALLREALSTILAFLRRTLYLISQISPKLRTRARITLRRRKKVHIETWKQYFQERYIRNLYQRFYLFGERSITWSPKIFPKWITRSRSLLRRRDKVHTAA